MSFQRIWYLNINNYKLNYGNIDEFKALEIDEIVRNQWKGRMSEEVKKKVRK